MTLVLVVQNTALKELSVTLDFSKCANFDLHGPPQQKAVVKPFSTVTVAHLTQIDVKKPWSWSYKV